jgi:hypothetical protein
VLLSLLLVRHHVDVPVPIDALLVRVAGEARRRLDATPRGHAAEEEGSTGDRIAAISP